jgi:hypothetical protein
MSHQALRRVMIRLLHDPALVDAVHADVVGALADVDLTAEERGWLVAVPRAAWHTDAERPHRVLDALRDEFPASFALAPSRAEAFFRSLHFHAAVQTRGSLALAFGAHMAEDPDVRVTTVACLESATASVRRAPVRIASSPAGNLRLTPAARVVRVRRHGAALLAAVRERRTPPSLAPHDEVVLVLRVPDTAEVTIEPLPEGLAHVLARAGAETPRARLVDLVRAAGAGATEADGIVDRLVADSILL